MASPELQYGVRAPVCLARIFGTLDDLVDEHTTLGPSDALLSVAREPTIADWVFNQSPAIGSESFVKQHISSACP